MSTEQQQDKGVKTTGKTAGSIRQYATIGGGKRTPESQDEASSMPAVTPSNLPAAQASSMPDAQKKDRDKTTVYLEPDLNEWMRARARQESRRLKRRVEISDIVNEALLRMKNDLDS